jgi:hypothetical protein
MIQPIEKLILINDGTSQVVNVRDVVVRDRTMAEIIAVEYHGGIYMCLEPDSKSLRYVGRTGIDRQKFRRKG